MCFLLFIAVVSRREGSLVIFDGLVDYFPDYWQPGNLGTRKGTCVDSPHELLEEGDGFFEVGRVCGGMVSIVG